MGRPKKTENGIQEETKKEVKTAKQVSEPVQTNILVRHGSGSSPSLYKAKFRGRDVWLTKNQILVTSQSQPDLLELPEDSPFLEIKRDVRCKTCGK